MLRSHDWNAGYLRDDVPIADLDAILDDSRPACIVVDERVVWGEA